MAIQKPTQTHQYELQEEIASRVLLLNRDVVDNGNGSVSTVFGATVYPKSITYELDAQGNKTGIYESNELGAVSISFEELMSLFAIQVTLKDGTVSAIGEVLSSFIDQILASKLGLVQDITITTQPIDIAANLVGAPDPAVPDPAVPDPAPPVDPIPAP